MATGSSSARQTPRAVGRVGMVGVAAAVMLLVTACGSSVDGYKDGPPYTACGQTIPNPAGASLENFSSGGAVEPGAIVELVANCSTGVQLAISPHDFAIVDAIHSKDGAYQAVKIEFAGETGPPGTLTVSQHGRTIGQMTLLAHYASPSSGSPGFCDPLLNNCG